MNISYWPEYTALNSVEPYSAALESLVNAGHTLVKESYSADAAIIWSVLWQGRMAQNQAVWNHYQSQNKPVIVVEVGGIYRGTTWKVGINGVNRDAEFGIDAAIGRADSLGLKLTNWNTSGEFILVCGQHDRSLQWQGMPAMQTWFLNTYYEIRKYTSRPILFRPHPRCRLPDIEAGLKHVYRQNPVKLHNSYDDFNLVFNNVWTTISWSSNPGPQSVIAGIPAIVGPSSLAWNVAAHNVSEIENPVYSNRQQWLDWYAGTEYTVDEISQGLPWRRLRNALNG